MGGAGGAAACSAGMFCTVGSTASPARAARAAAMSPRDSWVVTEAAMSGGIAWGGCSIEPGGGGPAGGGSGGWSGAGAGPGAG